MFLSPTLLFYQNVLLLKNSVINHDFTFFLNIHFSSMFCFISGSIGGGMEGTMTVELADHDWN